MPLRCWHVTQRTLDKVVILVSMTSAPDENIVIENAVNSYFAAINDTTGMKINETKQNKRVPCADKPEDRDQSKLCQGRGLPENFYDND